VRTAELHLALAAGLPGDEFSVEPMTSQYLRGLFQSMRSGAVQNFRRLRKQLKTLPADLLHVAQQVVELEPAVIQYYRELVTTRIMAGLTRTHGDLHLDQVLWTGRDFMFLDFEGDSAMPISERRIKRSPLRDVARMLRSFHHAMYTGFYQQAERGVIPHENLPKLEPWVRQWNRAVSRGYYLAYCDRLKASGILPAEEDKLRRLILAYLLDQVIDELGNELLSVSSSIRAPLQALIYLGEELSVKHTPENPAPGPASK
jgi:maltose alpha-D-glucosyltransferase/alpha-amylase